ncbi:MAG: hypothetical protein HY001_00985 [Candidatus Portnoybacteria bacterium]|nr:hypothetical protein [Candidatus Portnoybacteria bacterium]
MQFFKKKEEYISRTAPGFEESERKTTKAGIILLLVMVIVGTFFGWRALDDLGRIPDEPARLSDCSYRYRENIYLEESSVRPAEPYPLYYEREDSSRCIFNDLEKASVIPSLIAKRIPLEKELTTINDQLIEVQRSLQEIRYQLGQATQEYSVGLQEQQAKVIKPVLPPEQSAKSVSQLRSEEGELRGKRDSLDQKKASLTNEIEKIDGELKEAYKPVFREQNKLLRWYEFKVFLLQMLFVFPFFLLVFWGYLRLHRKDSPYTIIFTAMLAVAAILAGRVFLFWFWGLFLERVLEILFEWFRKYQLLRSIVFYLGMFLSFALFGGAVYYLQKKIFDPRRVALRRLRAKECPRCRVNLDLSGLYCPNCGHQLRDKCSKCKEPRFIDLPHCPHCGAKTYE